MKENLKMIIFDMDGVLIDSEPLHEEARQRMFRRLGLVPDEKFPEAVGKSASGFWDAVIEMFGLEGNGMELEAEQYGLVSQLARENNTPPSDGLVELLGWAKANGIKIGVASSSNNQLVGDTLDWLGIRSYLDCVVTGDAVEHKKPDPEPYLKALALGGVSPEEAVAVEDSNSGVLAAKRAGIFVFGYQNPTSGEQNLEQASAVIKSLREIVPYIEKDV